MKRAMFLVMMILFSISVAAPDWSSEDAWQDTDAYAELTAADIVSVMQSNPTLVTSNWAAIVNQNPNVVTELFSNSRTDIRGLEDRYGEWLTSRFSGNSVSVTVAGLGTGVSLVPSANGFRIGNVDLPDLNQFSNVAITVNADGSVSINSRRIQSSNSVQLSMNTAGELNVNTPNGGEVTVGDVTVSGLNRGSGISVNGNRIGAPDGAVINMPRSGGYRIECGGSCTAKFTEGGLNNAFPNGLKFKGNIDVDLTARSINFDRPQIIDVTLAGSNHKVGISGGDKDSWKLTFNTDGNRMQLTYQNRFSNNVGEMLAQLKGIAPIRVLFDDLDINGKGAGVREVGIDFVSPSCSSYRDVCVNYRDRKVVNRERSAFDIYGTKEYKDITIAWSIGQTEAYATDKVDVKNIRDVIGQIFTESKVPQKAREASQNLLQDLNMFMQAGDYEGAVEFLKNSETSTEDKAIYAEYLLSQRSMIPSTPEQEMIFAQRLSDAVGLSANHIFGGTAAIGAVGTAGASAHGLLSWYIAAAKIPPSQALLHPATSTAIVGVGGTALAAGWGLGVLYLGSDGVLNPGQIGWEGKDDRGVPTAAPRTITIRENTDGQVRDRTFNLVVNNNNIVYQNEGSVVGGVNFNQALVLQDRGNFYLYDGSSLRQATYDRNENKYVPSGGILERNWFYNSWANYIPRAWGSGTTYEAAWNPAPSP